MKLETKRSIAFQIILGRTLMFLDKNSLNKLDKNTYLNVYERLLVIESNLRISYQKKKTLHCETLFYDLFCLQTHMFKKYGYHFRKNIEQEILSCRTELNEYFKDLTVDEIFNNMNLYLKDINLGANIFKFNMALRFIISVIKDNDNIVEYI